MSRFLSFLLLELVLIVHAAYADGIVIPPIPQAGVGVGPAVSISQTDTKTLAANDARESKDKKDSHADASRKDASSNLPRDKKHSRNDHASGRAQFTPKPLGELPKPVASSAKREEWKTRMVPANPVRSQIKPTTIYSSQETHEVAASSLHENVFMMPKNVLKAFSSRKISVEIRGPIVIVRVPRTAGRTVDLQILTEDYHVETFILTMDARLPAQKFIVRPSDDADYDEPDPLRTPRMARKNANNSYGGAIDTLITIANGKEPKGFVRKPGDGKVREFRGLRIVHLGSFVRNDAEFAILLITNDTDSDIPQINEWNLHNARVLGGVENARSVEYMSLDKHSLKPGESTLMYVVMNHRRGRSYE